MEMIRAAYAPADARVHHRRLGVHRAGAGRAVPRPTGTRSRGMDLVADPAAGRRRRATSRVEGAWQGHAAGCDLVVHTAAIVSLRLTGAEEVWRANVVGTKHALDAAIAGGRAALRPHLVGDRVRLRLPRRGRRARPGQADRRPLPRHEDRQRAARPPGARRGPDRRARSCGRATSTARGRGRGRSCRSTSSARGRFVLPDGGRGIFSPVYVDDLVDGIVAAARSEAAAGQVLTLSDGVGVPNRDFFGRYADALGQAAADACPTPVAMAAARVAGRLGNDPDVNPRAVEYMLRRGHVLEREGARAARLGAAGRRSTRAWTARSPGCAPRGCSGARPGRRGR